MRTRVSQQEAQRLSDGRCVADTFNGYTRRLNKSEEMLTSSFAVVHSLKTPSLASFPYSFICVAVEVEGGVTQARFLHTIFNADF